MKKLKNYVEDMTQWQNPCVHKVLLQFPTLEKKPHKTKQKHVWGSEAKSTFGAVRWFSREGACLSQDRPFWKRGAQLGKCPCTRLAHGQAFSWWIDVGGSSCGWCHPLAGGPGFYRRAGCDSEPWGTSQWAALLRGLWFIPPTRFLPEVPRLPLIIGYEVEL